MMQRRPASTVLAVALAWAAHPAAAQVLGTPGEAQIVVAHSEEHGAYLTDARGRALYLFTADRRGTADADAESRCYGACAEAWPPLLVPGVPRAGPQVEAVLLSAIQREDGSTQVTYAGWPLYYFVEDPGPGATAGQDKHGFGGEWYLVTPAGEKAGEES